MPLQAAVTAPDIDAPAPAGGFEFDVAAAQPEEFRVRLTGAQTTGAGKGTYTNTDDLPLLLREVHLAAGTAPTGAALIVDVNVEGTSAFSVQATRPQLAVGQKTGSSTPARAGDPVVVAPGETITVDIDQVGSTVAGSDLTVVVDLVKRAANNREGELY